MTLRKLDVLAVFCDKCGRTGRYALRRLIEQRGRNGTIIEWCDALTADCPRRRVASISDQCHARCPDLPKVRKPPWVSNLEPTRAGCKRIAMM
jgi:hypothetical protein